jgi:hypothetical protein
VNVSDLRVVLDDAIDTARRNDDDVRLTVDVAEELQLLLLPRETGRSGPGETGDWIVVGVADSLAVLLRDFVQRLGIDALERLQAGGVPSATAALNEARAAVQAGPGTTQSLVDVLDHVLADEPFTPTRGAEEVAEVAEPEERS